MTSTGYEMAYVAVVARDQDASVRFLEAGLGLARDNVDAAGASVPCFGIGRTALLVFDPEHPFLDAPARPGVHHIALADPEPAETARRHGFASLAAPTNTGVGGAPQVLLDPAATAGVRTRITPAIPIPESKSRHVSRLDHLGIASADNDGAIAAYVDTLGCPLESTQTDLEITITVESFTSDKYPAVHHTRPSRIVGGLRDVFITIGDLELEFLQDYDPNLGVAETRHDAAGNTKGDQSAIAKYVAKYGPGLHHLAFFTPDIDAALAELAADGWRVIDRKGRPGGRASLIGFVHPSNFGGGLLMHFVQREEMP